MRASDNGARHGVAGGPTADDIAKNFNATKDKLLNDQREEIFRVYIGELTQKYEKGGAVKFSKQQVPAGLPAGN